MIRSRRFLWIGATALVLLGLITFLAAPASNRLLSGSTWGTAPDGYAAWYAYMVEQDAPIQRWQRPVPELLDREAAAEPAILMEILPRPTDPEQLQAAQPWLDQWLEAGNTLVVLGLAEPVTAAPFTTTLSTAIGAVKIQTRRRIQGLTDRQPLLADDYGAVVWQRPSRSGHIIAATTPFLAANAYADEPGNSPFLAELVSEGGPIYVNEYLHGYQDSDVVGREVAGSWLSYLAKTPLLLIGIQGAIATVLALLAQNRRPGPRRVLPNSRPNDSQAYIQALAGVLYKANSRDFLVETLLGSERQAIQRELGLGSGPVSDADLRAAWQAAGMPMAALEPLQGPAPGNRALKLWLEQLYSLRTHTATSFNLRKSGHE